MALGCCWPLGLSFVCVWLWLLPTHVLAAVSPLTADPRVAGGARLPFPRSHPQASHCRDCQSSRRSSASSLGLSRPAVALQDCQALSLLSDVPTCLQLCRDFCLLGDFELC